MQRQQITDPVPSQTPTRSPSANSPSSSLPPSAAPSFPPSPSIILFIVDSLSLSNLTYNAAQGLWTGSGTTSGNLAGLPFTTPLQFSLQSLITTTSTSGVSSSEISTEQFGKACSVLNLRLSPINVNLLGLHVDTSDICVIITAIQGGGLLGDLLCGLAGGDSTLVAIFQSLLVELLTAALAQQMLISSGTANALTGGNVCSGTCQVLNLVIGPDNLNLLGLQVVLNNCNNGPVQVCLSAMRSEGLLGSLLCSLAGH